MDEDAPIATLAPAHTEAPDHGSAESNPPSDSDSEGAEVGRAGSLGQARHGGAAWARFMVGDSSEEEGPGVDIDLLADSDEEGGAVGVRPVRGSRNIGVDRRQLEQHEAMVKQLLARK